MARPRCTGTDARAEAAARSTRSGRADASHVPLLAHALGVFRRALLVENHDR
eukprot:gene22402-33375_t